MVAALPFTFAHIFGHACSPAHQLSLPAIATVLGAQINLTVA